MSAMHWEARRRQNVLDRRMANKTKQCLTEEQKKQKQNTVDEGQRDTPVTLSVSTEPLVVDKRILSHLQTEKKEQYSAKIDNRYTSVQYSQQW